MRHLTANDDPIRARASRGLWRRAALGIALVLAMAGPALAQADQQRLVDRATLTAQEMLSVGEPAVLADVQDAARRARAAVICPRIFRAGFLLGGQGGSCVLIARDGAGSWSSPAFYSMGSGSIGLQVGIQDMQMILFIMTQRGLAAMMEDQVKIGADASIAIATIGGAVGGGVTTNGGADIMTYARSRGLFAGIALEGSVFSPDVGFNHSYYGRPVSARQIVVDMAAHNPAADPLRATLMGAGQTR